jgi:hypothetical protein
MERTDFLPTSVRTRIFSKLQLTSSQVRGALLWRVMAAVKASEVRGRCWCERWSYPDSPPRHSSLARLPSNAPAGLLLRFGERKPLSAPGSGFCFGRRLRRILFGRLLGASSSAGSASDPVSDGWWWASTAIWCCCSSVNYTGLAKILKKHDKRAPCHHARSAAALLHHRVHLHARQGLRGHDGGRLPPPSSSAAHHAGGPKRQLHRRPLLYYAHAAPAGVRLASPIGPAVVAVDPHAVITTADAKHTPSNFVLAYY